MRNSVNFIMDKVRAEDEDGVRHYSKKSDNWSPTSTKLPAAEAAKATRQLFGDIGIDLPADPTETLVVIDD